MGINFIGAVNIDIQTIHLVAVKHRNARSQQALGRRLGAGNRTCNVVFHGGQGINEFIDGGARAHSHNGVWSHIGQGGQTNQCFKFILCHVGRSLVVVDGPAHTAANTDLGQ